MRLLFFGTYDRELHPRVAVLLEGLRDAGHEVAELNAPLGASTAEKVAALGNPVMAVRLLGRMLARWTTLMCNGRTILRAVRPDAIVVGYLGHFDVILARLIAPRTIIALDHLIFAADTAADRGVHRGFRRRILALLDRCAVGAADLVIVDTQEHADMLHSIGARARHVVVPVGAARSWFNPAQAPPVRPLSSRMRVVFFGLFTPLQGARTIAEAIQLIPHDAPISFTLIGDGQDGPAVRKLLAGDERVEWLEWVAPEELPSLIAAHDACLGIFGTTPKAHRVVPNKIYQGIAAGCAVITADSAPQRRALPSGALFVDPGSPEALARALLLAAGDRALLQEMTAAAMALRESFRPVEVVAPLEAALAHLIDSRSGSVRRER